jgi:hypothetical protein
VSLQLVFHVLVGEAIEDPEFLERHHVETHEPLRSDGGQIDTAPLHIDDLLLLADDASHSQFDGGVTTAVKNKTWVLADQTGGVRPGRKRLWDLGMLLHVCLQVVFIKNALHDLSLT